MKIFGTIVAGLLTYLLNTFVFGIVLMFMWNWFIVPLGVMKIGFWLALGISMTINCFFGGNSNKDKSGFFTSCFVNIFSYLLVWGLGAIIQLFI